MGTLGLCDSFVMLVMICKTTLSDHVLINGKPFDSFSPQRGLCQQDPISPHVFLICVQDLSALIRDCKSRKVIHGFRIANSALIISHLFLEKMISYFLGQQLAMK